MDQAAKHKQKPKKNSPMVTNQKIVDSIDLVERADSHGFKSNPKSCSQLMAIPERDGLFAQINGHLLSVLPAILTEDNVDM